VSDNRVLLGENLAQGPVIIRAVGGDISDTADSTHHLLDCAIDATPIAARHRIKI
jgi:hypothetical protein